MAWHDAQGFHTGPSRPAILMVAARSDTDGLEILGAQLGELDVRRGEVLDEKCIVLGVHLLLIHRARR